MSDPLVTYIEDHKAGAALAIDLLQAMKARHNDESLSQFAESILVGVEEDEETLRGLSKEIGTGSNFLKEAAAWVGEKASRIKLGAGLSGGFGTFEALEFLSIRTGSPSHGRLPSRRAYRLAVFPAPTFNW